VKDGSEKSAAPRRRPPRSGARDRDADARCASCGARLSGRFCSQCGVRAPSPHDYELKELAHEATHELFHLDGKILRTLRALFTKPGLLAAEYFAGRQKRYTRPLALFVLLNLVFFVVRPHTGLWTWHFDEYVGKAEAKWDSEPRLAVDAKLARTGESREVYAARFDLVLEGQKQSFLFFVVPVFALALALVEIRRRRRYAEHLVFAVHYYAVVLAAMLALAVVYPFVVVPVLRMLVRAGAIGIGFANAMIAESGLVAVLFLVLGTYLYFGLRRFYGERPLAAAIGAILLFAVQNALIYLFRSILFWTAFLAT
jgi:hypothetical protein